MRRPEVSPIPVLETERLVMRGHVRDDFEACAALWGDAAVTRFVGGQPLTSEEAWSRLLRYAGHWALMRFGYWAVIDRASGAYVGDVGLADYKRVMSPSLEGAPEMGWVLAAVASGRGLATEAVNAALAWCDANLEADETVCIIADEHDRSVRVATKAGFQTRGLALYRGNTMKIFARPRRI